MSPVSPSRSHISSARPPSDLDYWRVQLPSRPHAEQVARLVPHENASWDDASNLALLQLLAPVNLSAAPRPVCLPHPEHYFLPGSLVQGIFPMQGSNLYLQLLLLLLSRFSRV